MVKVCIYPSYNEVAHNIDEVRNDLDDEAIKDYQKDVLEFVNGWDGDRFDTILLDPPYAYRKWGKVLQLMY